MGVKASDIIASTILALFLACLASILYSLDWRWTLGLALVFDPVFLFLLRNQSKNYRKWKKHPTTFPNPTGGGILGQYQLRPWQNELAEMGGTKSEKEERETKKLDRNSKRKARKMKQLQKSN